MKKITFCALLFFCAAWLSGPIAQGMPGKQDSLRVDTVLSTMKSLVNTLKTDIQPKLSAEAKGPVTSATKKLDQSVKSAEAAMQAKPKSTFPSLTEKEKKMFRDLESQVSKLKAQIPEKSELYPAVAKAHIPIYKATQEMTPETKKPLLSTYSEPYDPNTSLNRQVTMLGAYMHFDTEYRITVGGMEIGPDIVDPERLVFTFPEKLLPGITEPTYVEIKASPKMKTGTGKSAKVGPYKEQVVYLLVYPVKGKG